MITKAVHSPLRSTLAAFALAAAVCSPTHAANLLSNGSFELLQNGSPASADYTYSSSGQYLQGWLPVANGYEHFRANSTAYSAYGGTAVAQEGAFVVDLAAVSFSSGGLQQSVNLGAGNYSLSFWAATSNMVGRDGTGTIDVSVSSGTPGSQQFSVVNHTVNVTSTDWQQQTFNFSLASAGLTTITLANNQNANEHFAFIDNVALVPEPHEWAMMLIGLGVVGNLARRRRVLSGLN